MNNYTFSLDYEYIDGKNEYYKDEHIHPDRTFPFCVAVSVIEGEYFVDFADGTTIRLGNGETIFIQSLVPHTVRMHSKGKLTHAHFLCSYMSVDIFALANLPYFLTNNPLVYEILTKLNNQSVGNPLVQKLQTDKLIAELLLSFSELNFIDFEKLVIEPQLHLVLQYIHTNLRTGITVDDLVAISGYSKTGFYTMFRNKMKTSPREYIESERLKAASLLLLKGKKIKDVAETIGFSDVSYFNKVFKRKYGMSPLKYKQSIILY